MSARNTLTLDLSRLEARLVVMDGKNAVPIKTLFGTPNKANLKMVTVDARGGDDSIVLDKSLNVLDANGKLAAAPNAVLHGGSGNDTIRVLSGGSVGGVVGNPVVGNTVMYGDEGNDFLDSGFGNDVMYGGPGDDTFLVHRIRSAVATYEDLIVDQTADDKVLEV